MNENAQRPTHDILAAMSEDWHGSWSELVDRWDSKLRVLLHFRLRDRNARVDPEDIRQETWAEAIRRFRSFDYRGPGSFYAWMAGIARHKAVHAGRRGTSVVATAEAAATEASDRSGPIGLLEAIEATQTSVGGRVANLELETVVKRVVGELPDPLREVILLRIYEGRSGRDVAELFGVHESTISLRLKKAIETCSQLLSAGS